MIVDANIDPSRKDHVHVHAKGMFEVQSFNPEHYVEGLRNLHSERRYPRFTDMNSYGVVDSVEQFQRLFGETLEQDPRHFIVGFTEVRREWQPESGGWRWHKWGPYYGDHDPRHEYLYDEVDIDSVFVYHVFDVTPTQNNP